MWLLVEGSSFCSRLALLLDRSVGRKFVWKRKFFGFFGFKSFFKSLDRKELLFISFADDTRYGDLLSNLAFEKVYFANVPKRLTGRSDDRSVKGARLRVESHTCAGTADRETSPWCRTTVSSLQSARKLNSQTCVKGYGSWLLAGPGTKPTGSHLQISEAARHSLFTYICATTTVQTLVYLVKSQPKLRRSQSRKLVDKVRIVGGHSSTLG
ncbi:hypothetical protein V8E51_012912 [Hyaloscypha variabilis]